MGRTLTAAMALALLTSGPTQGLQTPPGQSAGTAAISGVVTDGSTGRPIAGATVRLLSVEPAENDFGRPPPVLTDTRGRFVFVNLSSTARYTLAVSRSGYAVSSYERDDTASSSGLIGVDDMTLTLAAGEWKRDANIRLWRSGTIGGRVIDERGEPVVGTAVRLFRRALIAGNAYLVPGSVATTDDRGVYRMAFAEPGEYVVGVLSVQSTMPASSADGARTRPLGGLEGRGARSTVTAGEANGPSLDVTGRHRLILSTFATPPAPGGAEGLRAYAPVFHPGVRSALDAVPITIDTGTSRTDVDFRLEPVATATVTGRVSGVANDTTNLFLRLMAPGTEHLGFGSEVATTLVESDGTFTFLNVPAGDYVLLASPAVAEPASGSSEGRLPPSAGYGSVQGYSAVYADGQPSVMWWRSQAGAGVWGRLPVGVGPGGVSGLDLPLRPSASIRGRLVFDDPEPPEPSTRFPILFEPASGDTSLGMPNAFTAAGDETFAFEAAGLQNGRYLPRLPSFYGRTWRIRSVAAGGVDVTSEGLDGSAGADYNDVVVTLVRTGAELTGYVRGPDGGPARGVVMLFPVDRALWRDYGLTPDRIRSAPAGGGGAFAFTRLPDGDYYAIAVPPARRIDWQDPEFLAAAAPLASRVTLRTGVPATQDLRVMEVVVR